MDFIELAQARGRSLREALIEAGTVRFRPIALTAAAVVIGGTLTTGGAGSMLGTLYGVLIIGVITNMVNLFGNLPYWYSSLVTAALLLAVILLQSVRAAKSTAQAPSS